MKKQYILVVALVMLLLCTSCDSSMYTTLTKLTGSTQSNVWIATGAVKPSDAAVVGVQATVEKPVTSTSLKDVLSSLQLPDDILTEIKKNEAELQKQVEDLGISGMLNGNMLFALSDDQLNTFLTSLSSAMGSPSQKKQLLQVMAQAAPDVAAAATRGSLVVASFILNLAGGLLPADTQQDVKTALTSFAVNLSNASKKPVITNGAVIQVQLITNMISTVSVLVSNLVQENPNENMVASSILSLVSELLFLSNISSQIGNTGIIPQSDLMSISDLYNAFVNSQKAIGEVL